MLFTTLKVVGQIGIGIGSGTLVRGLVDKIIPENADKIAKVCVYATGLVMSTMTADKVGQYYAEGVDELQTTVERVKKEIKTKKNAK